MHILFLHSIDANNIFIVPSGLISHAFKVYPSLPVRELINLPLKDKSGPQHSTGTWQGMLLILMFSDLSPCFPVSMPTALPAGSRAASTASLFHSYHPF